jgi:predicted nuclease with TOPRIM domain
LFRLREIKQDYEVLSAQYTALKKHNEDMEHELQEANIYKEDLENHRRFIKVLELQKSELQRELDRIIQTYNNRSNNVFASLSKIDKGIVRFLIVSKEYRLRICVQTLEIT